MVTQDPEALDSTKDIPSMRNGDTRQELRVLVASVGPPDISLGGDVIQRLREHSNLAVRGLCDHVGQGDFVPDLAQIMGCEKRTTVEQFDAQQHKIAQLSAWADVLVLAPIDSNTLAKMLNGMSDDFMLQMLRGWDVSKKILLVPGMSVAMWENPMTRKQLNKLRRKWNWIRVLQPMLWHYDLDITAKKLLPWEGMDDLIDAVKHQADLMTIGHDMDIATSTISRPSRPDRPNPVKLPPEIWTIIYEYVGDWEVAKSLGVYTNLSTPTEWERPLIKDDARVRMRALEWAILCGSHSEVVHKLESHPALKWLSRLSVKLIIKFARTDLLSYLEKQHKELFWASFGHTLLPTKASAVFGKVAVLEWWRTSPSFLTKEYHADALDGASKAGFVHVLDWWRRSGLPLRYTEAALEQASARGNIEVLDWWKAVSLHHDDNADADTITYGPTTRPQHALTHTPTTSAPPPPPLRLKVGKSLTFAAQSGQASTLAWWATSSIPYTHEETVAKTASSNGHVSVLSVWKSLKGEKMFFDNQVLVGPTKNGHAHVLQWWKGSGFRVEYKTCDIEEALEDCLGGGEGEKRVRRWWAKNGLNLGVGTSEWMKVKVL